MVEKEVVVVVVVVVAVVLEVAKGEGEGIEEEYRCGTVAPKRNYHRLSSSTQDRREISRRVPQALWQR